MSYDIRRLRAAAAPHLEDSERVLGGTWGRTCGGFVAERAFGLAAGLLAPLGTEDRGPALPRAFEVAVTDQQLLFFGRHAFTARPHHLVAAVRLDEVAVAEVTTRHRGIESVAVVLRRGTSIDFEVARLGARAVVETFVACLNAQLATLECVA